MAHPVLVGCSPRLMSLRRLMAATPVRFTREVWRIQANLNRVLDLTDDTILSNLGLQTQDLIRDDYQLTNEIGEAAHEQRFQAVLAPSATGVDSVIAIFTENLRTSILRPDLLKRWEYPTDLSS